MLLIGEAPGASEDVMGTPFSGPAGMLLDQALSIAMGGVDWRDKQASPRLAFTNLVSCIPRAIVYDRDENDEPLDTFRVGNKIGEPTKAQIQACQPRLRQFYELAKPKKVVCVGKLVEKWITKLLDVSIEDCISIMHPAAILRADVTKRGLEFQRICVNLEDLFEEL